MDIFYSEQVYLKTFHSWFVIMYSWNNIYLLGPASSSHIKKNIQDCHWTNFPLFSVSSRYWLPPSSRMLVSAQMLPREYNLHLPLTRSKFLPTSPFLISIHAGSSSSTGEQTHTFWTHSRLAEPQWETEGHLKSSGVVSHEIVLSSTQHCHNGLIVLWSSHFTPTTGQSLLT